VRQRLFKKLSTCVQEQSDGKWLYQAYCSGCHGTSGKGDGPAAKTMPVEPADHTCGSMTKHSDAYLIDIIAKGGTRVGKSAQRDNLQGSVRTK